MLSNRWLRALRLRYRAFYQGVIAIIREGPFEAHAREISIGSSTAPCSRFLWRSSKQLVGRIHLRSSQSSTAIEHVYIFDGLS